METTKVGPKQEVKATAQDFIEKYNKLVEESGFQIVAFPTWVSTNHGSFEMVIQYQVGQTPKK